MLIWIRNQGCLTTDCEGLTPVGGYIVHRYTVGAFQRTLRQKASSVGGRLVLTVFLKIVGTSLMGSPPLLSSISEALSSWIDRNVFGT